MFAAVALFAASPASAGTSPDSERYIVVLKDEVAHPGAVARRHAENRGAEVGHVYGAAIKGYAAELAPEDLKAIRRDPSVAYVERDIVLRPTAQSVPTGVRRIGTLSNPTLDIDESDDVQVNADVAIIDSGVNTHPDLRVVTKTNCVVSGAGCADNSGTDGLGHGTHVAGIAGALDNNFGVVGVAPGARLWSVRVINSGGGAEMSDVIAGVNWVTERAGQIEVANMSLGCELDPQNADGSYCSANNSALKEAIGKSIDMGVVYVVSAGNESSDASGVPSLGIEPKIPASYPDVITVSNLSDYDGLSGGFAPLPPPATGCAPTYDAPVNDKDDTLANTSNWGLVVDIAAPGACIQSTLSTGGYGMKSGTSMAAPHVAGAAAILAAKKNPNNRSEVMAIRDQLRSSGTYDWTDDGMIRNPDNTPAAGPDGVREPLLSVGNGVVFYNPHPGNVQGIGVTSHIESAMQLFANASGSIAAKDYNPWANPWGWQPWGSVSLPVNAITGQSVPIVDPPAVTSRHSCCRDLFMRGADNQIYFRNWDSNAGAWSSWFWIPGPNNATVTSAPAAAKNTASTDALFLAVRGNDGQIHLKSYDPAWGGWSGWSALGAPPGGATADPAVTVHGKAVIHVMVKGGDGMIYDRAWSASTGWTGWISMGGPSYSSPALTTTWNNQEMFLFVRGTDNAIWYRRFLPQYFGWTNWSSLGGQTHLAPAGVSRVSSSAEVFLVGLDGKVQHRRFISSSNSWTSWMRVDDDCPPGAC